MKAKGRLIVLTGASHTGKSSVATEILRLASPPIAFLGVDSTLDHTLLRPAGERWREIPLAYELNRQQIAPLLRRGWTVIFESTFTFVPEDGPPQLHVRELERVIKTAEAVGPPPLVVHLEIPGDIAVSRATKTGRLSPELVRQTVDLHERFVPPPGTLQIGDLDLTPTAIACEILAALRLAG